MIAVMSSVKEAIEVAKSRLLRDHDVAPTAAMTDLNMLTGIVDSITSVA